MGGELFRDLLMHYMTRDERATELKLKKQELDLKKSLMDQYLIENRQKEEELRMKKEAEEFGKAPLYDIPASTEPDIGESGQHGNLGQIMPGARAAVSRREAEVLEKNAPMIKPEVFFRLGLRRPTKSTEFATPGRNERLVELESGKVVTPAEEPEPSIGAKTFTNEAGEEVTSLYPKNVPALKLFGLTSPSLAGSSVIKSGEKGKADSGWATLLDKAANSLYGKKKYGELDVDQSMEAIGYAKMVTEIGRGKESPQAIAKANQEVAKTSMQAYNMEVRTLLSRYRLAPQSVKDPADIEVSLLALLTQAKTTLTPEQYDELSVSLGDMWDRYVPRIRRLIEIEAKGENPYKTPVKEGGEKSKSSSSDYVRDEKGNLVRKKK